MENYILWSSSVDQRANELAFFAASVHVQRINQGTQQMIAEMLRDLEVTDAVERWSIDRFFTNYMADEQESPDWEDIWAETWEIKVQTSKPVESKPTEIGLIRSYARDDSWSGEFSPTLPGECVVIADFYSVESLMQAEEVLIAMERLRLDSSFASEMHSRVPQASEGLFISIHEACQKWTAPQSVVRRRPNQPHQLVIHLGSFDEDFFEDGAILGVLVCDLCHALGGTTSWNELNMRVR